MENTSRSISQNVKSGEYFKEAREWYMQNYVHIYVQRLYIVLMALATLGFACLIASVTVGGYFVEKYPFPIYFEDETTAMMQIQPLAKNVESVNISIARYLLNRYVVDREGYDPTSITTDEWQDKLRRVRALSSRSVFSDFDATVNANNPDSPIIRYKLQTKRQIKIEKVIFKHYGLLPVGAKVYYTATEITSDKVDKTRWVSEADFSMTNLENDFKEKIKLQFTVTKYNVNQVP